MTLQGERKAGKMWGPGRTLPRKFFVRGSLLGRWLGRIVLPDYWKPLVGAMALMMAGTLAEAASFLVAAQLLINWAMIEQGMPSLGGSPILLGGGALVALLVTGALCGYLGFRIAIRTILHFETASFAHAVGIARGLERQGIELSAIEKKELQSSAPRLMGRTLLQCIGLGTSILLALVGAAVCSISFPVLSLILGVILIALSPIFFYNTMHSTNVGHRMRETVVRHSVARKDITSRWLAEEDFDPALMTADAAGQSDYADFLAAYRGRLMISPFSRLLVNFTLSVCIVASLMWMMATLELNPESISRLVVFLIFLRVFFSGAKAIITAVQVIASLVPYFLMFLRLDPRMKINP